MNPRYVPRDYGTAAIDSVFNAFKQHRSSLLVMATGVGKTEIYLQIAERFLDENPGKRCLIIAHREELITQPARRWRRNREEWPAIEMGELRAESSEEIDLYDSAPMNQRIVIASIPTLNSGRRCPSCTADCGVCKAEGKVLVDCDQCNGTGRYSGDEWAHDSMECYSCTGSGKKKTKCKECQGDGWISVRQECDRCFEHFVRRMQKFKPEEFGLIIIDEAHHAVADSYTRAVRYFRHKNPSVLLLGLTATPDRADEEALGLVFECVPFEYSLPKPILEGWLTPIDQQFVIVEDLNLSNVRTTAGDLNSGDLEREMLAEKVLHKVTTPIVEIACGLEPGTINDLINQNRLEDLPGLRTKEEPTLIHAVDVAHAERMTEIINRYLPDSALCIIGATPKNVRRDGLKRFGEGKYQFLLSCGVFLEGTDLPNVSVVGMARPTKSRALYSQMIGRGLRPLSGLVDGIESAEHRVDRIAESAKPRCLVIDFVGNAGRHKLISAADILGNELPDELVNGVIRKAAKEGQAVDVLRALMEAQQEEEKKRQERLLAEARERQQEEDLAKKRAAERRAGFVAGASYVKKSIDPFDVFDMTAKREPGWHKGRKPSDKMKEVLQKAKVPFTEETTFWEAHLLIEEVIRRRKNGLCTYSQAKWLTEHGYSGELKFEECRKIMDAWAKNGWKKPKDV